MLHVSEGEIAARILVAAMQSGCVVPHNLEDVFNYYDKIFEHLTQIDKDTAQRELASFGDTELP